MLEEIRYVFEKAFFPGFPFETAFAKIDAPKAYSETCQGSKMKYFAKIAVIFFCKTLNLDLRLLTGFRMRLYNPIKDIKDQKKG